MADASSWTITPHLIGSYEFDHPADHPRIWMTQPFQVLMLTLSGRGILHRRDESPWRFPVDTGEGSLYFLHDNLIRYVEVADNRPMHMIAFSFDIEFANGLGFFEYHTYPWEFTFEDKAVLTRTILEVNRLKGETSLSACIERERLMHVLSGRLLQNVERKAGIRLPEHTLRCAPAVDYLNKHFTEEFDIDRLVSLSAVSKPHFFRLFRQEFNMTPQEYQLKRRLREAEKLLHLTELPVKEVARLAGWNDPFHFSRLFTRRHGVSPRDFRNSLRRYGALKAD